MDAFHPTYLTCREFGMAFLTPMLVRYVRELCKEKGPFLPVCLAREGWLIKQLLLVLQRQGLINLPRPPVYLQVSRTLLYRALLGRSELWSVSLKGKYKGSLGSLLCGRFGLQMDEAESCIPPILLEIPVNLPDDMDKLRVILAEYESALQHLVKPTLNGIMAYFKNEGLFTDQTPLLLDVGYSGTIQKLITPLLERDTRGLYLIATHPGGTIVGNHCAHMRGVLKEGVAMGDGYHMLDRSLFIECLLTAPHGQLVDIRQGEDGQFQYYYGRKASTQRHFQDLSAVHEGTIDGVVHAFRHGIDFSTAEIESLYLAFLCSRNGVPRGVWPLFSADDDISGNGVVNPLDLFGI